MSHVLRQPWNAKARQSTAGARKKGKQRHGHGHAPPDPIDVDADPNTAIHVPKTNEQKDLERRQRIKAELVSDSQSKMNSKKRKRLDKYIDKKLQKEERVMLFERFKETQAELPSTLHLQSSASLGTGRPETHMQRMERDEHHEVRRAMDGMTAGSRKRKRRDAVDDRAELDSDSDDGLGGGSRVQEERRPEGRTKLDPIVVHDLVLGTIPGRAPDTSAVGSALKRNPDGSVVAPKVVTRTKKNKAAFRSWGSRRQEQVQSDPDAASESSFNSSDSANDSDASQGSADDAESSELEGEEGEEDEDLPDTGEDPTAKRRGFRDWALQQMAIAKGYTVPSSQQDTLDSTSDPAAPPTPSPAPASKPKAPHEMRGPLGEDLDLPATSFAAHLQNKASAQNQNQNPADRENAAEWRAAHAVSRPPAVQDARLLLPVVAEEQAIMEAVLLNPVVVLCGETGSGKTTQVPQFLYEAGFGVAGSDNPGMIGITQPRRVAAMAMATRVAHELSLTSSKVSYQIRYDATVSPATAIKFMTDGVLLRELATDFLLSRYSVIIIDEAHERSVNTDILVGVLSRVVGLREGMWQKGEAGAKPLRLIIMSATLRVSDFAQNTALFSSPPPVINIAARQHPVTIHFSRRTSSDYVTEAIKKAAKIHARLPPGGILIFLTGQNEIAGVCRRLGAKYGRKAIEERNRVRAGGARLAKRAGGWESEDASRTDGNAVSSALAAVEAEDVDLGSEAETREDLALDVDGDGDVDEDVDALDTDDEEHQENEALGIDSEESDVPMHILPLYSLLPSEKQMLIFDPPPEGARLVVVATNVAETSLTIPGIRYVIDCGRAKERRYDPQTGIQSFQVGWISKASAAQRAGRAGRTGPGHCYRLYSSPLFEHYFDAFASPEILRVPIEGVVLQMKGMHLDTVVNFPFPSPPDRAALSRAEKILLYLGALGQEKSSSAVLGITDLGRAMSLFPLSPRFSRVLAGARKHGCLPYAIVMVAALSVGDPFLHEEALSGGDHESGDASDPDESGSTAHMTSDAAKLKEANRARRRAYFQSQQVHHALGGGSSDVFRLLSVVGAYEYAGGGHKFCDEHFVRSKAMEEIHKLRTQITNIVQANFPDASAQMSANLSPPSELQLKVLRQLVTAAFIDHVAVCKDVLKGGTSAGDQYATARNVPYRAMGIDEDVFIHPSSVLADAPPPKWVVFQDIVRTSRPWMKTLTTVNPNWLSSLGKPALCTFSKPTKSSDGTFMSTPHFGNEGWELPPVKVDI